MNDRLEAVIRDKRLGWPTLIAGILWEAAGIAGNAAFLEQIFVKAGLWEMLKHAVTLPPLGVVLLGSLLLFASSRLSKPPQRPPKPMLAARTDEDIAALIDTYAGGGEDDVVIHVEREHLEKTSFTVIRKARRHA